MVSNIIFLLRLIIKTNWLKTIWINFQMLPFNQAVKLPIVIFGSCKLQHLRGKIVFTKGIKFGQLLVGISDPMRSYGKCSYVSLIGGTIVVGEHVILRRGLHLMCAGTLVLEDSSYMGDNNTIICVNNIRIGAGTRTAYDVIIMDTDFHYVLNTHTREIAPCTAAVDIGENCWIGGNCTIKKRTRLPKGTIMVGPYSSVGKDLVGVVPECSLIGGSPAKIIKEGYRRVNKKESDKIIQEHFRNTSTNYVLQDDIDMDEFCMPTIVNKLRDDLL